MQFLHLAYNTDNAPQALYTHRPLDTKSVLAPGRKPMVRGMEVYVVWYMVGVECRVLGVYDSIRNARRAVSNIHLVEPYVDIVYTSTARVNGPVIETVESM